MIDPSRLVFIDETWTKTNMAPLRGWGEKGERLQAFVPHGHWKTMTFLAALRNDGITAPCVFDGPINGASFLSYVEQFLLPTLKKGDIVVLDIEGGKANDPVNHLPAGTEATRVRRSGKRSSLSAQGSSSCQHTAQTSIPSNRSLQS